MKTNVLSKEDFVKVINEIQKYEDFETEEYGLYSKYNGNAPERPSLVEVVIKLLCTMYEVDESEVYGSDFDYYFWEIDFGRGYYDGCIKENGENVRVTNAEELYNWVTKGKE